MTATAFGSARGTLNYNPTDYWVCSFAIKPSTSHVRSSCAARGGISSGVNQSSSPSHIAPKVAPPATALHAESSIGSMDRNTHDNPCRQTTQATLSLGSATTANVLLRLQRVPDDRRIESHSYAAHRRVRVDLEQRPCFRSNLRHIGNAYRDLIFRIERFHQRPLERRQLCRECAFRKRCLRFDELRAAGHRSRAA